jgi:Lrp/AsnC family leucine-responsive transcriptional regulator
MANETRLDPVDARILTILQEDGRRTYAEIASLVGLTAPSAHERVKKLEAKGIIRGYSASLDAEQAGFGVLAYTLVAQDSYSHWDSVTSRFRTMPEVVECHHVAGDEDFILKIRARDTSHLERVLRDIQASGHVRSTRTMVVLSTPIEGRGVPLDSEMPATQPRAANHRSREGGEAAAGQSDGQAAGQSDGLPSA